MPPLSEKNKNNYRRSTNLKVGGSILQQLQSECWGILHAPIKTLAKCFEYAQLEQKSDIEVPVHSLKHNHFVVDQRALQGLWRTWLEHRCLQLRTCTCLDVWVGAQRLMETRLTLLKASLNCFPLAELTGLSTHTPQGWKTACANADIYYCLY